MELTRCKLGEGLFINCDGSFWWVDIERQQLITSDARWSGIYELPEPASKVLGAQGEVVILASTSGICTYRLNSREFAVEQSAPEVFWRGGGRANDGCLLPSGEVLIGRMRLKPTTGTGDVVEYKGGEARIFVTECAIPNTFILLPSGDKVLISDSMEKKTYAVEVGAGKKSISDHEIWHDFTNYPGTPDGGVLGSDGHVYLAMWGAATILKLTVSGEVVDQIPVDAMLPTSVQESLLTKELVITSATSGMSQKEKQKFASSGQILRVPL